MANSSVCDGPPPSDSTPSRPSGRRGSCGSDCFAGFLRVAREMHPEEESRPSWSRHQGCERTTVPERRADAFDRLSRHPSGSNSACIGIIAYGRLSTRPTSRMQIISAEHSSGVPTARGPTQPRLPPSCRPCSSRLNTGGDLGGQSSIRPTAPHATTDAKCPADTAARGIAKPFMPLIGYAIDDSSLWLHGSGTKDLLPERIGSRENERRHPIDQPTARQNFGPANGGSFNHNQPVPGRRRLT